MKFAEKEKSCSWGSNNSNSITGPILGAYLSSFGKKRVTYRLTDKVHHILALEGEDTGGHPASIMATTIDDLKLEMIRMFPPNMEFPELKHSINEDSYTKTVSVTLEPIVTNGDEVSRERLMEIAMELGSVGGNFDMHYKMMGNYDTESKGNIILDDYYMIDMQGRLVYSPRRVKTTRTRRSVVKKRKLKEDKYPSDEINSVYHHLVKHLDRIIPVISKVQRYSVTNGTRAVYDLEGVIVELLELYEKVHPKKKKNMDDLGLQHWSTFVTDTMTWTRNILRTARQIKKTDKEQWEEKSDEQKENSTMYNNYIGYTNYSKYRLAMLCNKYFNKHLKKKTRKRRKNAA